MLFEKSRNASLIAAAITVVLAASSTMVLFGGCTSPTKPADTSKITPVDSSQIVLLTPQGGETFHVGDSLKVTWKLQGKGLTAILGVDVELSPDNGTTWGFLSHSAVFTTDANWENFIWKIPATIDFFGTPFTLTNNSKCLLRVEQYSTSDPNQRSATKTTFTIVP